MEAVDGAELLRRFSPMVEEREICMPLGGAVADTSGETVREHNSRRCMVCQRPCPPFGFGPPLTRRSVWACSEHRAEVDRQLSPLPGAGIGKPTANQ